MSPYAAGKVDFSFGMKLLCETDFPHGFTVRYTVSEGGGTLSVRIPEWSERTEIFLSGEKVSPEIKSGYAYIGVKAGDVIEVILDSRAKFVYSNTKAAENTGCAAVQRGALVYCFEGIDNGGDVLSLSLDGNAEITAGETVSELGGVQSLKISGYRTVSEESLYSFKKPEKIPEVLTAVPYYTWGNRGENQMRVWLPC